jgi:DNA-directed DNA polymerase III PolC
MEYSKQEYTQKLLACAVFSTLPVMRLTHLHTHSWHSLLQGVPDIPGLVSQAKRLGFQTLALTDRNTTAGLILFLQECRKQAIKPILGLELSEPDHPERRLVLLARNATGYGDLCELVTHLLRGSPIPSLFLRPFPDLFALCPNPELLADLQHTEARPILHGELLCNDPATRATSRSIEALCKKEGIPLVATSDVHFLNPEDHDLHMALRAIAYNTTPARLSQNAVAPKGAWLRPAVDMERLFARIPEALHNTEFIANSCQDDLQATPWILPKVAVPEGHTPEQWLEKLAFEGLQKNYGNQPTYLQAKALQQKELTTIAHTGYASYFLMVKQVRDYAATIFQAKFRRGRECSIMRGSAANCLTFYNIGASDLDPVRYGLYFERFLNESRTSPPDADLDFGWDERDRIMEYFFKTWGEDHVCILCTTNTFQPRGAFREAAKVLGYSDSQVAELYALRRQNPEDPDILAIGLLASQLLGRPHFLGQHPGGVIVTNDPIWRHVGCQRSGGATNRIISQIDMHSGIDFLGLVKFDILGNGSLSVLRDTLEQIEEQGHPDPEVWNLEKMFQDPGVQSQMREGGSLGVFYLESPAQTRLNKKAHAETFEEIGMTSSLIRPAGTAYAKEFVRRHRLAKEGLRDWEFIHPSVAPILQDSHDICVFQEDVTRLCVEVAGLSFALADKVRKMMNSMHDGEPAGYSEVQEAFVVGAMQHSGLTEAQAREVWSRIDSFRGFSFCKSHSLSYAQLSFRCAWLKEHYPAQFMAGVISNGHGFYSAPFYLDESRRMGLVVAPLDINQSRHRFQGMGNILLPGFLHVRRLTQESISHLIQERNRLGPYQGLGDVLARNPKLRTTEAEALAQVGAFDCLGISRVQAVVYIRQFASVPKSKSRDKQVDMLRAVPASTIALTEYSFTQKCLHELEILGYMITGNLLEFLAVHPSAKGAVTCRDFPRLVGQFIKVFGISVTQRVHRTSKGKLMMFLTLQNEHGLIDCILWPKAYQEYKYTLESSDPCEIWGTVTEDAGTYSLEVSRLQPVPWSPAQVDIELGKQRMEASNSVPEATDTPFRMLATG